jgi:predicted hydrocarbon binding protein
MEDFYDSDIGAQTADILVLPSSFLKTLWKELTEGLGEVEGQKAFFRCGETVGESLAANYSGDTGQIDALLNQAWAEAGLGLLFVLEATPERVICKVESLLEVNVIGIAEPCNFTSGCIAGVLKGIMQHPYSVEEDSVGEDTRIFTFKPV